jgi:hypothetical protein
MVMLVTSFILSPFVQACFSAGLPVLLPQLLTSVHVLVWFWFVHVLQSVHCQLGVQVLMHCPALQVWPAVQVWMVWLVSVLVQVDVASPGLLQVYVL